jgi:hypothetical protein
MMQTTGRRILHLTLSMLVFAASCVASTPAPVASTSTIAATTTVAGAPESPYQWPVVAARDFIHRPDASSFGIPISFPDPMYCGCPVVTLQDGRVLMVGSGHSIGYEARIWDPGT